MLESQLRCSDALQPVALCGLKIDEICLPGNTLLWDLMQDQNIVSIAVVIIIIIIKSIYTRRLKAKSH